MKHTCEFGWPSKFWRRVNTEDLKAKGLAPKLAVRGGEVSFLGGKCNLCIQNKL